MIILPFPHARLAAGILRAIAPLDYPKSYPIYLLPESAMEEFLAPAIRHLSVATTAFTGPDLDQALSAVLKYAGCWRGRGFAVVFRDKFFNSLYGKDEGLHFREGLMTLLHEAAHNLDFRSFTVGDHIQFNSLSQEDHHGERWTRAFLHLQSRVPRAYSVSSEELPKTTAGRGALAGELEQRRHDSILKILADDPPRQFSI